MGYITADREQIEIIGYSIGEFVEADSKCRFIVNIIKELDLRELHSRYSTQGGEAYDPEIMLGILFLGYCEGITSSRKLERASKKDLEFIFVSANLQPDHCSISRFRKNHIDILNKYFLEIIEIGRERGIGEFKILSTDGTKMQANSSKKKSYRERGMDRYIAGVEKDIEEYLKKSEESDEEERKAITKDREKLEKTRYVKGTPRRVNKKKSGITTKRQR